jgi:hypothetical protein
VLGGAAADVDDEGPGVSADFDNNELGGVRSGSEGRDSVAAGAGVAAGAAVGVAFAAGAAAGVGFVGDTAAGARVGSGFFSGAFATEVGLSIGFGTSSKLLASSSSDDSSSASLAANLDAIADILALLSSSFVGRTGSGSGAALSFGASVFVGGGLVIGVSTLGGL